MSTQGTKSAVEAIESAICVKDILDDITQAISSNIPVEDVYSQEQLKTWAEANGFKKED